MTPVTLSAETFKGEGARGHAAPVSTSPHFSHLRRFQWSRGTRGATAGKAAPVSPSARDVSASLSWSRRTRLRGLLRQSSGSRLHKTDSVSGVRSLERVKVGAPCCGELH